MKLLFPPHERNIPDAQFSRLFRYYDGVQRDHDFCTVWSIFDVEDLTKQAVEGTNLTLTYDGGWGTPGSVALPDNPTFVELWEAADTLVRLSTDFHHTFIEAFKQVDDNTIEFVTGS